MHRLCYFVLADGYVATIEYIAIRIIGALPHTKQGRGEETAIDFVTSAADFEADFLTKNFSKIPSCGCSASCRWWSLDAFLPILYIVQGTDASPLAGRARTHASLAAEAARRWYRRTDSPHTRKVTAYQPQKACEASRT